MGLVLKASALLSRVTRKSITNNKPRGYVSKFGSITKSKKNPNFFENLFNMATQFAGSLLQKWWEGVSSYAKWIFTGTWSNIVAATQFVWNFNFNITDADLDKSIATAFDSLYPLLGGTIGNAIGWLACGALPGAVIMAFNEPMGGFPKDLESSSLHTFFS